MSCERLGASPRRLGVSWDAFGASWGCFGASWKRLGAFWASLGVSGGVLGHLGGVLGCKINLRLFFVVFVTSFLIGFIDCYLFSSVRRRTEMASTW